MENVRCKLPVHQRLGLGTTKTLKTTAKAMKTKFQQQKLSIVVDQPTTIPEVPIKTVKTRTQQQKLSTIFDESSTIPEVPMTTTTKTLKTKVQQHKLSTAVDQPPTIPEASMTTTTKTTKTMKAKAQQQKLSTVFNESPTIPEVPMVSSKSLPSVSRIVQLNKPELPQDGISVKWTANAAKKTMGNYKILSEKFF